MASWLQVLALGLAAVSLFLSLWIVVPAPTFSLLPLGVGAPEVSVWMAALSAIALVLLLAAGRWNGLGYGTLAIGALSLGLSLLPLVQVPSTNRQFAKTMVQALQVESVATKPSQSLGRVRPFVWQEVFTGIAIPEVQQVSDVEFAQLDGISLRMELYYPTQARAEQTALPTIVVIHGGGWQSGNAKAEATFNRYLAAQGYAVAAITYRLAPQYQFPVQLQDVNTAIAFLRSHAAQYRLDPNRMVLMGRSAGAHLALLAVCQPTAPPVRAVVSYYGPVDLVRGYRELPTPDPLDVQLVLRTFLGGTPDDQSDRYRQASPIQQIRLGLPPMLLVHGQRDHIAKSIFAKAFVRASQAAGNTVVYLELPWSEHGFDLVFRGLGNQMTLFYLERFLAWVFREP